MEETTCQAGGAVATAPDAVKFPSLHVKDITGARSGKLTAVEFLRVDGGIAIWKASCDCGGVVELRGSAITYKSTLSCGCLLKEVKAGKPAPNRIDHTGRRYGRLLVIERSGSKRVGSNTIVTTWLVKCDCGTEKVVIGRNLGRVVKSCGCLYRDTRKTCAAGKAKPRLPVGEGELRRIEEAYIRGAKDRGFPWGLTRSEFRSKLDGACFYCGCKPSSFKKMGLTGGVWWNGIDRIDNGAGYIPSNIVTCCAVCNHAKRDMQIEEFLEWVKRIHQHSFGRKRKITTAREATLL